MKSRKSACHVVSHFLAVMDCGFLTDPANGRVSHTAGTTFGQTATYTCDTGFNLVGDNTRMCQVAGVWSGNAPTCQGELLISYNTRCVCVYTSLVPRPKEEEEEKGPGFSCSRMR